MSRTTLTSDPIAEALPAVAAWHAAWAGALGLTALGAAWSSPDLGAASLAGLLVLALPGLGGLLVLTRRRDAQSRMALIAGWTLAAVLAAGLTGGLAGPLAGLVFAPLAAGLALGERRWVEAGAMGAMLAAGSGLLTSALGGAEAGGAGLAAVTAVLTAGAAALAPGLAGRPRERRADADGEALSSARALTAAIPGAMMTVAPSGRVLQRAGSEPDLVGEDLIAAAAPDEREPLRDWLAGSHARGEAGERLTRLADGRTLRLRAAPLNGPNLAVLALQADGAVAQLADLAAQRDRAEARDAGKSRFLAHMSHELRTPLNAVVGFSDIMRQRLFGPLPERYAEYAGSIHEAGGHLLDLINDVLDVSKIEADRYELALEPFDAREAIEAVAVLMRGQARDKGVELAVVLPAEPLKVMADRRALKQMALNLVSNAIKFTPLGGSVSLAAERLGPMLEVTVSDTGVGIAAEDLARLGRPYEQAGGADQKAQGSGLGLSLVRSLAELHGGRLMLDSTLGEGSAATVRLPVIDETPAAGDAPGGAQIIPFAQKA